MSTNVDTIRDLAEREYKWGFISDIEAAMSIILQFSFERRTATPNYLAFFASVILDQRAADAFTRT